ncbi:DNA (cytosine-5-)-methyltransferase [Microbacterium sp. Bi121]|uniref:DNA cytosine methyltransferase n=1 Tax=Microbacterium sp. Bi121 TaxID=2822348 RepID=UPI001DA39BD1|nr:DNA (cytosine-5-)-methyltransferase [Microbacterium sp. Bi121]CAH0123312.1 Modification methylase BanI [Microbacterium sp. Bi121]
MNDSPASFNFIDLFAGLGGFHVALEGLGGRGVFAAEWEPTLNELYSKNFPTATVWSDVSTLDSPAVIRTAVPDHEVLTAGFPCQPFSKAGEQLGFGHTLQGQLFFRVLDILKEKRPRRFILENVPNILRHKKGETLRTILAELENIGYAVDWHQYSPHQFGDPQIRERAYFVGSLDGLDGFDWPEPTHQSTDIRTALDGAATPNRPVPDQTVRAIDMWDDFLRRSGQVKLPSFPIWSMEFGADYPYGDEGTPPAIWAERGPGDLGAYRGSFGSSLAGLSRDDQFEHLPSYARRDGDFSFPGWKQAFIRQNRQFFWANRVWLVDWMNEWRPWEFPQSLQKFEWNVQGGERRIDDYVLQVRASGIRVKRTTTAPSLIAMTHTQVPILGKNIVGVRRYMTPRECAKLQSLGDLGLPESDLAAYKALGNAVNARVVRAIAEPLVANLTNSSDGVVVSTAA